jgi:hypothetical protein
MRTDLVNARDSQCSAIVVRYSNLITVVFVVILLSRAKDMCARRLCHNEYIDMWEWIIYLLCMLIRIFAVNT